MTPPNPDFMLGQHAATLETLVESQLAMRGEIQQILSALSERKGERRMLLWLVGLIGSASGAISTLLIFLLKKV